MLPRLATAFLCALVALSDAAAVPPTVRTRAASRRAVHDLRMRLHEIRQNTSQNVFSESISLDKSFNKAVLLSVEVNPGELIGQPPADAPQGEAPEGEAPEGQVPEGNGGEGGQTEGTVAVEVVCSRCYVKGLASATLNIEGGVGPAEVFDGAIDAVEEAVAGTIGDLTEWIGNIDFDLSDFELSIPAPNLDFNVDLSVFPDTILEFRLDNLDMFMEIETTLSGGITHELPLFRSAGLGLELAPDLFLGLVFGVDLILSADAELSLTSGFHLALDDAAVLKVALFSQEATDLAFNGGRFEFLPVTLDTAQGKLRALLQVSLRAGFELSTPDLTPGFNIDLGFFDLDDLTASAGVETRVFANVVDLLTTIEADLAPDADCALNIVQEYTLAVGAAAGATVALGDEVFGPTASTEIPIFTATLADLCAIAAPTPAPQLPSNQTEPHLTTTTLTREATHTVVECRTTGLCQCPASMQTLRENIVTETIVTSVPVGVVATLAETTGVVESTATWGAGVGRIDPSLKPRAW